MPMDGISGCAPAASAHQYADTYAVHWHQLAECLQAAEIKHQSGDLWPAAAPRGPAGAATPYGERRTQKPSSGVSPFSL